MMNSEDAPPIIEASFIVTLKIYGRIYFAIWQDGKYARDKLVVLPGTSKFLLADTLDELLENAKKIDLQFVDEAPSFHDMDKFLKTLATLRPLRIWPARTCKILLKGWNMLEDMARSVEAPLGLRGDKQDPLWMAYEKLFCGNNLPAMTPEGEVYHPWFRGRERKAMRRHLRKLWREIVTRSGQFPPVPHGKRSL